MKEYGKLMSALLPKVSSESAEVSEELPEKPPLMTGNPNYKQQGPVLIEIPTELRSQYEVHELQASLEAKGWEVRIREMSYSTEDTSDGESTGRPIPKEDETLNNAIMNGLHSVYEDDDLYKVVTLVRPEDTLPGSHSDIIFLMNSDGDVLDYLRNQGLNVVDESDALHRMLLEDKNSVLEGTA